MNQKNAWFPGIAVGAVAGVLVGSLATLYINGDFDAGGDRSTGVDDPEPLYWVAPMDPNYRRDKPGKSPMGMDLVPVYADGASGADTGPGTIRIVPEVINNLGVRTATATRQPLHTVIRTVGYVQYDQDRLIHIHPRVQGWIETLHVKAAGNAVQKGQPLYELYSPELVNAQEELVLALNRKNERLVKAAEDRLQALQISSDLIRDLKGSRTVSQTTTFYAPQAGVVDNLNIREGFFVNPGTTLMSIGALDDVWVEAEVFERQASLVKVGMPVTMSLEYLPGRDWRGQVDYIYPSLDEQTRTLRVRLRFDNSDGVLRPNMFAQVVLHASDRGETLIVPKEAVIRTGSQDRVVLALGDGRFKSVAITLGRLDENNAEILRGLSEGERVVTSAQFLLDSESSKTSDFKRMEAPAAGHAASVRAGIAGDDEMEYHTNAAAVHDKPEPDNVIQSARVNGAVNIIDTGQRILNISRGPIAKWGRPAATLDFLLDDSLDIQNLAVGDQIDFRFEIREGHFVLVEFSGISDTPDADR